MVTLTIPYTNWTLRTLTVSSPLDPHAINGICNYAQYEFCSALQSSSLGRVFAGRPPHCLDAYESECDLRALLPSGKPSRSPRRSKHLAPFTRGRGCGGIFFRPIHAAIFTAILDPSVSGVTGAKRKQVSGWSVMKRGVIAHVTIV